MTIDEKGEVLQTRDSAAIQASSAAMLTGDSGYPVSLASDAVTSTTSASSASGVGGSTHMSSESGEVDISKSEETHQPSQPQSGKLFGNITCMLIILTLKKVEGAASSA